MKRLFSVKNKADGRVYENNTGPVHFQSKTEAKKFRDGLNLNTGGVKYVVALGPDHRRYVE